MHTDYKDNLSWLQSLPQTEYKSDALILAGDVSDDLQILSDTLSQCKARWRHVFFTPGNHELWIRKAERGQHDSLGKTIILVVNQSYDGGHSSQSLYRLKLMGCREVLKDSSLVRAPGRRAQADRASWCLHRATAFLVPFFMGSRT